MHATPVNGDPAGGVRSGPLLAALLAALILWLGAMAAVLAAVRGQERSGREPVELTPGTCPARKASTKSRWSSCVWRA